MPVRLMESLATTGPLAELFSDASVLRAMLDFEAALARVEGRLGIIPRAAAQAISGAAQSASAPSAAARPVDSSSLLNMVETMVAETLQSGTPAIPFVREFTAMVRAQNSAAAGYVHWGATSQDVCDTALVLLLQKAQALFESDLRRLERALKRLAEQHRRTVMLGRTWLQAAPPVTFGLKAAGWFGAVHRGHRRLSTAFDDALVLQFGGASGTLAALGKNDRNKDKDGARIAQALAEELKLACPEAPWHTHRDRLAALLAACGVLVGSLGKMARDITLLAQNEVAEVAEPTAPERGGSSTMPHKQNPVGSAVVLAAAQRVPGLVAGFLSAMVQEHERAVGGWQAEWSIVSGIMQNTGLAISGMAQVAEGLTVDEVRMRANIQATRGAVFSERAAMLLGEKLGRDIAHKLVKEATRKAAAEQRSLSEVLGEMPAIAGQLRPADLRDLENPEHYLGAAEEFRKRLLAAAGPATTTAKPKKRKKR